MKFRYDFVADKLDRSNMSRFKKQATHYIGTMRQLTYSIYFRTYVIDVDIVRPDDSNAHQVDITICDIIKNGEGEVVRNRTITPSNDLRFKSFKVINDMFPDNQDTASFESNSAEFTVKQIAELIKILYKINNLRVFL